MHRRADSKVVIKLLTRKSWINGLNFRRNIPFSFRQRFLFLKEKVDA
jgi:hypothetical protein